MTPMLEQLELFRLPPQTGRKDAIERHILLGGRIVTYALRRGRRRLSMRIDDRGLAVGAPHVLAVAEIEAFIASHGDWVVGKLDEYAAREQPRHVPIHDGAQLPVLGEAVRVRVTAGNNRGFWQLSDAGSELWLAARPTADLSLLARRALQRRVMEHCRPRLAAAAEKIGRPAPPLALSSARTRWGSCSSQSGIRLNWRLVHLPPELVDYVIAHEVAHLVEMNHSPRFWALVERLHPDWRSACASLKRLGSELPLI